MERSASALGFLYRFGWPIHVHTRHSSVNPRGIALPTPRPTLRPRHLSCVRAAKSTTAEEEFDLVDERNNPLGISKPRSHVHRDGDWHRSVHIWLVRPSDTEPASLLLQQRSALKDTFPGCYDVSSAGHISAGDKSRETALREVEEELGIELSAWGTIQRGDGAENGSGFEVAFTVKSQNVGATARFGAFRDNEHQDVYIVEVPRVFDPRDMRLQESEVTGVIWLPWRDYRDALGRGDARFVPRPTLYQELLFGYLEDSYKQSR